MNFYSVTEIYERTDMSKLVCCCLSHVAAAILLTRRVTGRGLCSSKFMKMEPYPLFDCVSVYFYEIELA